MSVPNHQHGPDGSADLLINVVSRITYKPGWIITLFDGPRTHEHLAGGSGLTLRVQFMAVNSTDPNELVNLDHYFAVPPAAYDRETWERWVLDCLIQMETHECLEMFKVDGFAPYFPPHGDQNGRSPYTIQRRPTNPHPHP